MINHFKKKSRKNRFIYYLFASRTKDYSIYLASMAPPKRTSRKGDLNEFSTMWLYTDAICP